MHEHRVRRTQPYFSLHSHVVMTFCALDAATHNCPEQPAAMQSMSDAHSLLGRIGNGATYNMYETAATAMRATNTAIFLFLGDFPFAMENIYIDCIYFVDIINIVSVEGISSWPTERLAK